MGFERGQEDCGWAECYQKVARCKKIVAESRLPGLVGQIQDQFLKVEIKVVASRYTAVCQHLHSKSEVEIGLADSVIYFRTADVQIRCLLVFDATACGHVLCMKIGDANRPIRYQIV